jgi:hypothetical protein
MGGIDKLGHLIQKKEGDKDGREAGETAKSDGGAKSFKSEGATKSEVRHTPLKTFFILLPLWSHNTLHQTDADKDYKDRFVIFRCATVELEHEYEYPAMWTEADCTTTAVAAFRQRPSAYLPDQRIGILLREKADLAYGQPLTLMILDILMEATMLRPFHPIKSRILPSL